MANKEVWISVVLVFLLLALGVLLTQKTTWFESSYNYSDFENLDDGFGDFPVEPIVQGKECSADSDCVPALCCLADSCTPRANALDCSNAICTLDCKPGTLDCGQGRCACVSGKCAVR